MSAAPPPARENRLTRLLSEDELPEVPASAGRAFLNRHLWLFLLTALALGLMCGVLSELFDTKWNERTSVSLGMFVAPPVLLGFVATDNRRAYLVGATTLLAAALGHFACAQYTPYGQNNPEYWAWLPIGLVLGPLLGHLGHRIRSRSPLRRAVAGAVPVALLCTPLYLGLLLGNDYIAENANPALVALDLLLAALLVALCRGRTARPLMVLGAAVLLHPVSGSVVLASVPLTYYGGGF